MHEWYPVPRRVLCVLWGVLDPPNRRWCQRTVACRGGQSNGLGRAFGGQVWRQVTRFLQVLARPSPAHSIRRLSRLRQPIRSLLLKHPLPHQHNRNLILQRSCQPPTRPKMEKQHQYITPRRAQPPRPPPQSRQQPRLQSSQQATCETALLAGRAACVWDGPTRPGAPSTHPGT